MACYCGTRSEGLGGCAPAHGCAGGSSPPEADVPGRGSGLTQDQAPHGEDAAKQKLFTKWIGPTRVQQVLHPAAYMLELLRTWRAHNVFYVSLLKPYIDNDEAVDPVPYTLIGGADNEFEVEVISDFKPKAPKRTGQLRKVRDLSFHVKWLGLDWGVDALQPLENLKGTCDDALTALAKKYQLPADIFPQGHTYAASKTSGTAQRSTRSTSGCCHFLSHA